MFLIPAAMNFRTYDQNTSQNWSISTPTYPEKSEGVTFVQVDFIVALVFSGLDVIGITLGSLANIILIGLVICQSELRKITDVFTSSLCVSDLLASVLFQPFVIHRLLAREPNEAYEWALRRMIGQATLSASAMSLLTATLDRYIVLHWPLRYQNVISKRTAMIVVIGIWLASFGMGATAYFRRDLSAVVFPSILAVIVASIVAIQILIFIIAKKQVDKIWRQSSRADKRKRFLSNMRASKTVAVLLAVFLISWLPSTIFRFYDRITGGDLEMFHKWLHPLNALIQIHCSLDPYLYVFRNRRFKNAIAKVAKHLLKS